MAKQKRRHLQDDMPLGQQLRGWSDEQMAEANDALAHFDDSYNAVDDRIKDLGGGRTEHSAYHGTVKSIKGKGRDRVNIWEPDETNAWGDGYSRSCQHMESYSSINPGKAEEAAWEGFAEGDDDDDF